ncbi:hypothetical protein TanjilG_03630 [Lupinus angustifolius]|uniref:Uncharacterized protein n=1 Tax=Lupinus angustifolius TaxID=3871 RepID=A0A4P1RVQ7_LUPAN|nr:hypothetical protein TanjilG_03630 [Lupinus angustifolius]
MVVFEGGYSSSENNAKVFPDPPPSFATLSSRRHRLIPGRCWRKKSSFILELCPKVDMVEDSSDRLVLCGQMEEERRKCLVGGMLGSFFVMSLSGMVPQEGLVTSDCHYH